MSVIILRYLRKEIYKTLLLTVGVLLLVLVTNQLVNLLNRAALGQFTAWTVVKAVTLGIPQYLTFMVPLGFFLAVVIIFGRMSASSELLSMQASGLSRNGLAVILFKLALPVVIFVAFLSFWLAPLSRQLEFSVIERAAVSATLGKISPNRFQLIGQHAGVVHIENKRGGKARDVLWVMPLKVKRKNDLPLWDAVRAKSATESMREGSNFLVFNDGRRVIFQPGNKQAQEFWFHEYGVRLPTPPFLARESIRYLSMPALWALHLQGAPKAVAEWQWRFAMPLSVLAFAALSLLLLQVHARQGKWARILPAVLIYAVYVNLLFSSRSWLQMQALPTWIGMWWLPVLAFSLVGLQSAITVIKRRRA